MLRKYIRSGLSRIFSRPSNNNAAFNAPGDKNGSAVQDVYAFAAFLGRRFNADSIIDIGYGRAKKRAEYSGRWVEWDSKKGTIPLKESRLNNSVIICNYVLERVENPLDSLKNIKKCLDHASVAIITTSDLDLVRVIEDVGFNINFRGLVRNGHDREKNSEIFVLGNNFEPDFLPAPDEFRIVAIMTAYNEEDIIMPSISYLNSQGIEVYLIDNWSTDSTYQRAHQMLGKGLTGIEKFPVEGPSGYYDWENLLGRVESLASEIKADWFIHHDVDEIRESPWPEICLKDAIYHVDRLGFNAIDHTVIVFHPVDDNYVHYSDFRSYYSFFDFGGRPGHFIQTKAWKNLSPKISIKTSGGHDVKFDGRRVFPYKFLLRHYPIRSLKQADGKITRRKRYSNPKEREKGWHTMYDSVSREQIIRKPVDLLHFRDSSFYRQYLVERLSGVGINGFPVKVLK